MNKKAYIAPTMEVVNVETVAMIAASVGPGISTNTTDRIHEVNGSRGNWDDIW